MIRQQSKNDVVKPKPQRLVQNLSPNYQSHKQVRSSERSGGGDKLGSRIENQHHRHPSHHHHHPGRHHHHPGHHHVDYQVGGRGSGPGGSRPGWSWGGRSSGRSTFLTQDLIFIK